jgi:hypothetical protein
MSRFILGAVFGAAGSILLSVWHFASFKPWHDWLTSTLPSLLQRADYSTAWTNFSAVQTLHESLNLNPLIVQPFAAIIWMAMLLYNRGLNFNYPLAAGCLGITLLPNVAWYHYQTLLVPCLLLLGTARSPILLTIAYLVLAIDPLWWGGLSHALANLAAQLLLLSLLIGQWRTSSPPRITDEFQLQTPRG